MPVEICRLVVYLAQGHLPVLRWFWDDVHDLYKSYLATSRAEIYLINVSGKKESAVGEQNNVATRKNT